uniref:F-box domain-containing protein n=1 Tax=Mycena chlorophos TaxID=658473 RepID=A0ABQ0LTD3_MYCCL|nr:predicted protein [Mycena chlorophos]
MNPSSTPWNELRAVLAEPSSSNFRERVLRSMLRDAENNVHALDAEMAALSRRREQEQARITSLKDALAPFRKLPTELAVKIFSEVEHGPQWPARRENEFFRVLNTLSLVCSHWRAIILDDRNLWAQDAICLLSARATTSYVDMVERILQRSAPRPVAISLGESSFAHSWSGAPSGPSLSKLLTVVARAAPRWRSFACRLNAHRTMSDRIWQLLSNTERWSHLQNLELTNALDRNSTSRTRIFLDAPALHRALIHATATWQVPVLPWGQLQDLTLNITELGSTAQNREALEIIALCPFLVALNIKLYTWKQLENQDTGLPDVTLMHLGKLRLEVTTEIRIPDLVEDPLLTVAPFFTRFTFPVLRTISIDMPEDYSPDPASIIDISLGMEFISFLGRSSQLESLALSFCLLDPDFLRDILANTPSLTKLSIKYPLNELDDTLFEHLTYSPSRSVVAPKLHTLCLLRIGKQFTAKALVKLIHSRWWTDGAPMPVARWQHVSVFCRDDDEGPAGLYDLEVDFKETVLALRDQGLRLETNFPPPWSQWDYDND